ncbi:MAG: MFS transporter, partial [Rubrivivax sp.]
DMRQPFHVASLLREYRRLCSSPKFMMLVLASGVPFNGMFLYVLASPVFLGEHLHFQATQFFWLFLCTIGGIMLGAFVSGRLAGKMSAPRQIMRGFRIMLAVSILNVALNLFVPLSAWWALPLIGVFSFGWALMVPVVTLLVLDQVPERRGMASSLQASIGSAANGLVAGLLVPLVMHSPIALALASAGLMSVGLVAWYGVRRSIAS